MTWPGNDAGPERKEPTMLNLRRRISVRIPDRLAIAAALLLTLTAAGGVFAERLMSGSADPATAMPASEETVDPHSDETAGRGGLTVGLLLFGHG